MLVYINPHQVFCRGPHVLYSSPLLLKCGVEQNHVNANHILEARELELALSY